MDQEDVTAILPSIKVHPFPDIHNFSPNETYLENPKASIVGSRKAFLECPICLGIDDFYSIEEGFHYKATVCQGNKEPVIECGDHEHRIACAGINHKHFHIFCYCCQSVFFLEIPGAR